MTRRCLLLVLSLWALSACSERPRERGPILKAELGIFFGGQVEERDAIPFCLDKSKQSQGFRIQFREPLARPAKIRWEIDRPNPKRRGRKVDVGQAEARMGLDRFDQEIVFAPGDALGIWNVRVLVNDELVIDRPLEIYDREARRRARQETEARSLPLSGAKRR